MTANAPVLLKFADRTQAIYSTMADWVALPGALVASDLAARRLVIVTHAAIRRRHGAKLATALSPVTHQIHWVNVPSGEASKSPAAVARLYAQLAALGADRRTVLVALGGGVLTDLVGYVAATYLRGLEWLALPTSLVAQLDSAIGGKVGINLPQGKNLVGAIWPARIVYNHRAVLESLPAAGWRDGAVEAFKCGLIADSALVRLISQGDWSQQIAEVIARAVRVKCRLVARDWRDDLGRRALLNFGHTVGHGLEVWGGFARVTHGEAVALGMLAEAAFAQAQGWCRAAVVHVVADGLQQLGVRLQWPRWRAAQWSRVLTHDKKRVNTALRMPIVTHVGRAAVREVPVAALAQWLSEFTL